MYAILMVTWIPSIYPSHVSIYTSTMDLMGNDKGPVIPDALARKHPNRADTQVQYRDDVAWLQVPFDPDQMGWSIYWISKWEMDGDGISDLFNDLSWIFNDDHVFFFNTF